MKSYRFLQKIYADAFYQKKLVEKGEKILIDLCLVIEESKPEKLSQLYVLTQAATDRLNDLQDEFLEQDSEIETVAREAIAEDFLAIAKAYGFFDAEVEELIANRDW